MQGNWLGVSAARTTGTCELMRVKSSCGTVPLVSLVAKLMSVLLMKGLGPPAE